MKIINHSPKQMQVTTQCSKEQLRALAKRFILKYSDTSEKWKWFKYSLDRNTVIVSSNGRIAGFDGNDFVFLQFGITDRGYHTVFVPNILFRRYETFVHYFIITTFRGLRPKNMLCRHLNDVKTDNRKSNLRWGTRRENQLDSVLNNKISSGANHYRALLASKDARNICKSTLSNRKLADKYGVSTSVIMSIKKKKRYAKETEGIMAVIKKRNLKGSSHPRANVNESIVKDIRSASGTLKQISMLFSVPISTVHKIRSRSTWKHVP